MTILKVGVVKSPEMIELEPGVSPLDEELPNSPIVPEPTPSGGIVYLVQKGDTLAVIARQYGVSVQSILEASSFSANRLKVGQQLLIPEQNR